MKFGGTSVGNSERIRNVVGIVSSQIGKKPVVVVSALGGVTDILIGIANTAISGNDATDILNRVISRHYDTIEELNLNRRIIENEVAQLCGLIQKLQLVRHISPRELDEVMSFGERMSARIVAAYMSSAGIESNAYDAYDIGMITTSVSGDADILTETYQRIRKGMANKEGISVITGFIGKSKRGYITTLGRGGSDYTASIIGAAIGAEEIQIWTDVNGIMTADPKIVRAARSIERISYSEASELAVLGAKVLHPKTILPAVQNNIPVRILNTFNPQHSGTIVLDRISIESRVASIAYKKHIVAIKISGNNSPIPDEFMRLVSEIFEAHGASAEVISVSGTNIHVTVDEKQGTASLIADLKKVAHVEVKGDRAKVSLVGNGLGHIPDIRHTLSAALKSIKIEMISSNMDGINQSVVIKEKDTDNAVKRLHTTFFSR